MSDPIRDAIRRASLQTGVDLLEEQVAAAEPSGPFDFYHAEPMLPEGKTLDDMIVELMRTANLSREVAAEVYRQSRERCRLAKSSKYQVAVFEDCPNDFGVEMVHLSIKRLDREPIHDWRDLQRIKNAIVGEEAEAIELYPAESRLVDAANQYHLFCIAPGQRFPVGFDSRLVQEHDGLLGSKQRPFESPDATLPSRAALLDAIRFLLPYFKHDGSDEADSGIKKIRALLKAGERS